MPTYINYRQLVILSLFLAASLPAFDRQKLRLRPARRGAPTPVVEGYDEGIPFRVKESSPVVPLICNNSTQLWLMIDSGAEINVVAEKYRASVTTVPLDNERRRVGGVGHKVSRIPISLMAGATINGLALHAMRTAFVDLRAYNDDTVGQPVDGILGTEMLRQFRVAIDFRYRRLYLMPVGASVLAVR